MTKKWSFLFQLVLLLLISSACAINPVTGKRQLMLVSTTQEIELGREADQGIVATYGLYGDEELARYMDSIGQPMARNSHRSQLEFSFKVLDSPVINAFAVPGGYVYVTRGILPYLGSEAELAGVLGHEIGHITARHSAKQISQVQLAQLGLGLGSALSDKFRRYSGVAQVGVGLLMLRFSRDNEREADRLGVEYATSQGFAAGEMANFFATLERMSPHQGGGLPDWLSTHPAPDKRVETVRQLAEEWRQKVEFKTLAINRETYFERIDGLVFGADPRQGYVYEGVFYHPEMRFQFPLPEEWSVSNEPSQVQILSREEDAVILLTLGSEESPSAEAEAFLSGTGITPLQSEDVTVNGNPAWRLTARVSSDDTVLRLLSYFIRKDDQVFIFHGLTDENHYHDYSVTFESTMGGFRSLGDPERINVQPDRLRIRRASRGGSLQEVLRALGTPDEHLDRLSLINGMTLDTLVEAGALLKVVEFNQPGAGSR